MTGRADAVDRYFEDLLSASDEALRATLTSSDASGLPSIAVSPMLGSYLELLARALGARRILEIGTLGGYSTIRLARGLGPEGSVVTLELDPHHAEVARANIERAGFAERVEVRVGPAAATLDAMIAEAAEPFDLVFIDADKGGYPDYLERSLQLARTGTVIVADNVVRDGAVIDEDSDDPNVVGVRRFMEMAAADPRVDAAAIQTVGAKGYDGFAFLVVR